MSGHTLWTTNGSDRCAACHGATPVMPQINGGKSDSTVLDHVFPGMGCAYATGLAVGGASRDAIAQYLQTLYPSAINTTTPLNTNKALNVSSYVSPGGLAFTHVRTVSNPINEDTGVTTGTLTYGAGSNWAGTSITYDPPNNFTGYVTFTYRGVYVQSGSVILNGHTHTARIRVGSTPFVTSGNHSGTVGTSLSTSPGNYTITATNAPTSYGTTGLTAIGLSRSGSTIFGTPDTAGRARHTTPAPRPARRDRESSAPAPRSDRSRTATAPTAPRSSPAGATAAANTASAHESGGTS